MFKREFKVNFKSLLIWTGVICALFLLVYLVYPSMSDAMKEGGMDDLLKAFPEDILKSFNMDIIAIDTAFGWYKTEGYVFLLLIGGIYSAMLGANIYLKEENDKTIDFLLAKPIKRKDILIAKILCGISNISILIAITTIFNYFGLLFNGDFDQKVFFIASIAPILIFYSLFSVSLFISSFFRRNKSAVSLSIGIVFMTYIFQMIGNLSDKYSFLKNISFFELSPIRYIVLNRQLPLRNVIITLIIMITFFGASYYRYSKKEFM